MKPWMKQSIIVGLVLVLLGGQMVFALEVVPESLNLQSPAGMTVALDGSVYLVDQFKNQIYQWDDGEMTLVAGVDIGISDYPEGATTLQDGGASGALFYHPQDIAAYGNLLYVADTENSAIRQVINGQVRTLLDEDDGLERPTAVAVDEVGDLYIADGGTGKILRYDLSSQSLSTYVKGFLYPTDMVFLDDGTLLVVDSGSHQIKSVSTGRTIQVVTGQYVLEDDVYIGGYADGTLSQAIFQNPKSILVDDDTYYVTDFGNSALRKIQDGQVTTLVKFDPQAENVYPIEPYDMVLLGDNLYVSDTMGSVIFSYSVALFADVSYTDWYYDAVRYSLETGLFQGTSATTFSPMTTMSRAMFAQVLYNREGAKTAETDQIFSDVSNQWYADAVYWVSAQGIAQGTSETVFSPNQDITREQMVSLLYRYAQWLELDTEETQVDFSGFTDAEQISDYAQTAMEWAYSQGIIQGTSATTLDPQALANRAEAATMILNFSKMG